MAPPSQPRLLPQLPQRSQQPQLQAYIASVRHVRQLAVPDDMVLEDVGIVCDTRGNAVLQPGYAFGQVA